MAQTIWEVRDNLTTFNTHYLNRREAVNAGLGLAKATLVANPGSYWKIESWAPEGDLRTTVRNGPNANSSTIADVTIYRSELLDVAHN